MYSPDQRAFPLAAPPAGRTGPARCRAHACRAAARGTAAARPSPAARSCAAGRSPVDALHQRRRHVEYRRLAVGRGGVHSGDLVLVLVGHHAEQLLGRCARSRSGRPNTAVSRATSAHEARDSGRRSAGSGTRPARAARSAISASRSAGGAVPASAQISSAISGRSARMRPHRKARRFTCTAAPFSSIARRIAASPTGIRPLLPGQPEQHRVHRLRVAEQLLGQAARRAAYWPAPHPSPARWCGVQPGVDRSDAGRT